MRAPKWSAVARAVCLAQGAIWLMVFGSIQPSLAAESAPSRRPNILWIIADDLGVELGCYGTPLMRTPNIDRLAQEGARFTRWFTTAPGCSPSRSALMRSEGRRVGEE